jgi:hypothetical protein
MQTKYNIGDMVYVADVDELKIYVGTIYEITIDDNRITYKVSYMYCEEKECYSTFEEARTYLIRSINAQHQEKLDKVLALKDKDADVAS